MGHSLAGFDYPSSSQCNLGYYKRLAKRVETHTWQREVIYWLCLLFLSGIAADAADYLTTFSQNDGFWQVDTFSSLAHNVEYRNFVYRCLPDSD
jgi:hypothetical protein